MSLRITGYWLGVDLSSGSEMCKVNILLPGGLEATVDAPPDYYYTVKAYLSEKAPAVEVPVVLPPIASPEPTDRKLEWRKLPEAVLTQRFKYAFDAAGVPDLLTLDQVLEIRRTIDEQLTDETWAALDSAIEEIEEHGQEEPESAPEPDTGALIGGNTPSVSWSEGSVVTPAVRSRTVPKDEYGYPIVSQQQRSEPGLDMGDDGVEEL